MDDNRFRVVLAHDDDLLRTELRRAFSSSGSFTVVHEASNGLQAINAVASHKPDAVVVGLLVPVINALGALPLLRAASPDTKVMVLSVVPNAKLSRVAAERGATLCEREDLPAAMLVERLYRVLLHPSHASPAAGSPRAG